MVSLMLSDGSEGWGGGEEARAKRIMMQKAVCAIFKNTVNASCAQCKYKFLKITHLVEKFPCLIFKVLTDIYNIDFSENLVLSL